MTLRRRERGLFYEDFEVGRKFDHHWGRTLSETDGVTYSCRTMQYNPIYFNVEYARQLGYEGIVINPLLVFTTVLGLSVEDLSEAGGPFLGVEDLRFVETVRGGDTITATSVVLSRRPSKSRPGWGIVEWRTSGRNQRDQLVVEYRRTNLSRQRETKVSK